jgi:ABC-type phosphate/phosphonate transport system permease subunit
MKLLQFLLQATYGTVISSVIAFILFVWFVHHL